MRERGTKRCPGRCRRRKIGAAASESGAGGHRGTDGEPSNALPEIIQAQQKDRGGDHRQETEDAREENQPE